MSDTALHTNKRRHGYGRTFLLLTPVLLLAIAFYFLRDTDSDYWWHVRTGQLIVDTLSLPRVDVYSYTAQGQPWITHEWLSQIALYLTEHFVGYWGNVLVFGLLGALTLLIVYATCRLRGLGEVGAVLFALGASILGSVSANVRPQMATVFLLSLTLFILTGARVRQSKRWLWALPFLMVLWVNLHGGYVIGLALIWLTVLGELLGQRLGQSGAPVKTLLAVAVFSLLAALVNPNGLNGIIYPFTYAGTGNASMRFIQEWQSPDFHAAIFLPLAGVLLLVTLAGIVGPPLGLVEILWSLLFGFMALQSARHVPLYAIVIMPLLGARLATRVPALQRSLKEWKRATPLFAFWLLIPLVLFAGLLMHQQGRLPLQMGRAPNADGYPVEGLNYLQIHPQLGKLFNEYGWGGYLIYHLYPERLVFIDGRADVYGDAFLDAYDQVAGVTPGWREVLEQYDVGVALLRKDAPEAVLLESAPGWKRVFEGEVEAVFVREDVEEGQ